MRRCQRWGALLARLREWKRARERLRRMRRGRVRLTRRSCSRCRRSVFFLASDGRLCAGCAGAASDRITREWR